MSEERRKDVGLKIIYVILTAIITFLMSIVFFETYRKAEGALVLGSENKKDIAVVQETIKSIGKNFDTVNGKLDLLLGWRK